MSYLGRYYPEMPPSMEGETADTYTDRLTGADRKNQVPYDHRRNRQCSIGYHDECSDPQGAVCECSCHQVSRACGVMDHVAVARAVRALALIREDIPADVKELDGAEFTGRTVSTAIGNLAAQVDALAGILQEILARPELADLGKLG